MKTFIYRVKYTWHLLHFKQTEKMLQDCNNELERSTLQTKKSYHERSAFSYIMKL